MGDDLWRSFFCRLVFARLEDEGLLTTLENVLILVPELNIQSIGSLWLVPQIVFLVLDIHWNESKAS